MDEQHLADPTDATPPDLEWLVTELLTVYSLPEVLQGLRRYAEQRAGTFEPQTIEAFMWRRAAAKLKQLRFTLTYYPED